MTSEHERMADKVEIKNVLQPGKTYRVDAEKFAAASKALLSILPTDKPGLTQSQMSAAMRDALQGDMFPGSTAGWWMKSAQLHLEAEGLVLRDPTKPLTWRKA